MTTRSFSSTTRSSSPPAPLPIRPPIAGLDHLGPREGVHLLHSMGDTFALMRTLEEQDSQASGDRRRRLRRPRDGRSAHRPRRRRDPGRAAPRSTPNRRPRPRRRSSAPSSRGTRSRCRAAPASTRSNNCEPGSAHRLEVSASGPDDEPLRFPADLVLVSVGVRPDSRTRRRRRRRARNQRSDRRRPPDAHQPPRRPRRR